MKILGVTMGKNLGVFVQLMQSLPKQVSIAPPAIYVTDAKNYLAMSRTYPHIEKWPLLSEWEITGRGKSVQANQEELTTLQKRFDRSLWNAILADRRLIFGKRCKFKQDYASRFTEQELMGILIMTFREAERFLDNQKPDLVLSFGTATIGDYVFELLAKERNIDFWQIKATKVGNRIFLGDTGMGIPSNLSRAYDSQCEYAPQITEDARKHISSIRSQGVKYEGAILFSEAGVKQKLKDAPKRLLQGVISAYANRRNALVRHDNHVESPLAAAWYQNVVHPLRIAKISRQFPFLEIEDIEKEKKFVFFPLHFEPEVAIQIFGKAYQNQIETIRNLALSVPMGMKVLVKEHPRSMGFRQPAYYKKLLDIPNVRLINPFLSSINVVRHASLVTVISGSIGLEAAVCGKPVIVLGSVPYQILPDSMVRTCHNVFELERLIPTHMADYKIDEGALEKYFCTIIANSIPINFYTKLLAKKKRHVVDEKEQSLETEYERLAIYFLDKTGWSDKQGLTETLTHTPRHSG